jgi:hypothetical protein
MIPSNTGFWQRSVLVAVACVAATTLPLIGQDDDPLVESEDTAYYDFWVGTWVEEKDGVTDTAGTRFVVEPSVNPAAFEERWRIVLDDGAEWRATALRAWDKTAGRWMYTWVSDNGLYQVWEGHRNRHGWWIYRHFDVDGDRYLSRQGFLPQPDGSVLRISQKSYDEGETWELRFQQRLVRE